MRLEDPEVQGLLRLAQAAATRAYCPYSRFPVGAAVLTAADDSYAGANVENASYGLTLCAERVAVVQAVAAGHRELRALVVYTPTATLTPPCGACRQVLSEFGPAMEIFVVNRDGATAHYRLDELLPGAFGPDNLAGGVGTAS